MKFHILNYGSFFASHAICGYTSWDCESDKRLLVGKVWRWVPKRSRCKRCERRADHRELVTPEIESAVEASLVGLAKVFDETSKTT